MGGTEAHARIVTVPSKQRDGGARWIMPCFTGHGPSKIALPLGSGDGTAWCRGSTQSPALVGSGRAAHRNAMSPRCRTSASPIDRLCTSSARSADGACAYRLRQTSRYDAASMALRHQARASPCSCTSSFYGPPLQRSCPAHHVLMLAEPRRSSCAAARQPAVPAAECLWRTQRKREAGCPASPILPVQRTSVAYMPEPGP